MRLMLKCAALAVATGGMTVAQPALAQSGGDYEALGLRVGAFMAYPKISVDFETTDNLFASAASTQGDTLWRVRPELSIESGWSRNALSAYVRGAFSRYNDFSSEDTDVFGAGIQTRLDAARFSSLVFGGDYLDGFEPRTSPGSPGSNVDPIGYRQTNVFGSFSHQSNRTTLSSRADWREFNYDDGFTVINSVIDQDFRDRQVVSLTGRVSYEVSPATSWFVQGTVNSRQYDSGAVRDSDGSEFLAGVEFEVTNLVEGEISVGYITQDFDTDAFEKAEGFGLRGRVDWTPTALTLVSATAARTVEDSPAVGTAGYLSTAFGASIQHELRRDIIVSGRVGVSRDGYEAIDRDDTTVSAGASATWIVNRSIGVTAAYGYNDRSSDGSNRGPEFTDNRATLTLVLQR